MKHKPRIRAVTFDAAGTLMQVAEPVGETYARLARDWGADLSPRALDAGFRAVFPDMPPMAFPNLEEAARLRSERAWWHALVKRVVQHAGGVTWRDADFDAYFDALFAHYASGAAWRAYPDARGALDSARKRGLRVAVVSNFDSRLPPILRELGLEALIDTVVHSTACGAAKPDARIFHHALRALDAKPETALHVGDNLDADYHGAAAAGMAAVYLDRRGQSADEAIAAIGQLGELDAYLA
jgi:putative hydrolase of the HAD superfamily